MNFGVLFLSCNDAVRQTSFTWNWAERAIQNVADYYFAQSGGRESITFKVFDWYQLPMSVKQWVDLGMGVGAAVRPTVAQGLAGPRPVHPHTDRYRRARRKRRNDPGVETLPAATNFTPQLISHELGHRYGAQDAWGDTADSPTRYHNRWCVMGAEGWPATYAVPALTDPAAQGLDQSGPGMSAPTLLATGRLQPNEHGVSLDLTGTDVFSSGGRVEELSALAGVPGPGWTRSPVVIRYYDFLVEDRIGTAGGWDRGLPSPGEGAGGWVVVHRNPPDEFPPPSMWEQWPPSQAPRWCSARTTRSISTMTARSGSPFSRTTRPLARSGLRSRDGPRGRYRAARPTAESHRTVAG